jgi:hypothetical protein
MRCLINGKYRNLPDFLVVGTGKAGTSSLYKYLLNHPEIALTKSVKETLFFHIISNPNRTQLEFNKWAITNFEDYLSEFDDIDMGKICGEICPSYLYFYDHTIENIKKYHPGWQKLKIIIILREPVDKIISHYNFVTNTLKIEDPSLEVALELETDRIKRKDKVLPDLLYVDNTSYYHQVKVYMDTFKNIGIFFYEDLKSDKKQFLKKILEFLEVNTEYIPDNFEITYNKSKRRKKDRSIILTSLVTSLQNIIPSSIKDIIRPNLLSLKEKILVKEERIKRKTRKKLKKKFKPEVKKLEKLIGRDLDFWGY